PSSMPSTSILKPLVGDSSPSGPQSRSNYGPLFVLHHSSLLLYHRSGSLVCWRVMPLSMAKVCVMQVHHQKLLPAPPHTRAYQPTINHRLNRPSINHFSNHSGKPRCPHRGNHPSPSTNSRFVLCQPPYDGHSHHHCQFVVVYYYSPIPRPP